MLLVCDYEHLIGNTCTINEQIETMAGHVLYNFITDIKNFGIFFFYCSETRDIPGNKQFAVCLCWVDNNYLVNEDLVSLVDVEQTDSANLTDKLKLLLSANRL